VKNQKTMGRPKKQPTQKQMENFNPIQLLHEDIAEILMKSKVIGKWDSQDVRLLINWFLFPKQFIQIKKDKKAERRRIDASLALVEIFSRSPDEFIPALPKMQKKIGEYFTNPLKKRMIDEAISHGWLPEPMFENSKKDFWIKSANCLAGENETPRTIENARQKIRKMFS